MAGFRAKLPVPFRRKVMVPELALWAKSPKLAIDMTYTRRLRIQPRSVM